MMMKPHAHHWRSLIAKHSRHASLLKTTHNQHLQYSSSSSGSSGNTSSAEKEGKGGIMHNVMSKIFGSAKTKTTEEEQQQQLVHHGEPVDQREEHDVTAEFSSDTHPYQPFVPSPIMRRETSAQEMQQLDMARQNLEKDFDLKALEQVTPHSDMTQPFDRVTLPKMESIVPVVHLKGNNAVKMSTIDTPHGPLRVGTVDTHAKMSTMVLMFEAGIRYEQRKFNEHGLSLVLNKLSFKESENFSEQRLAELHDKIIYVSTVDQETTTYSCDFYRDRLAEAVELLADTISRPKYSTEDINDVVESLKMSCEEQKNNPIQSSVLTDYMLESCFGEDQGLGHATLNITESVDREDLFKYARKFFRPERAVVIGVGVEHDVFVQSVRERMTFSHLDDASKSEVDKLAHDAAKVIEEEKSRWIGGMKTMQFVQPPADMYKMDLPSLTSFVMSFEGCSLYDDDIFTVHLLETILGGGDSFSAGGPGKGILSIINSYYLPRYQLYNMMCQHYAFKDTGIFCIHASDFHDSAKSTLDAIITMFGELHKRIRQEDIDRAKNRLMSTLLIAMEDTQSLAHNIAADLLFLNAFRGTDYLAAKINAVTMEDIQKIIMRILSSSPAVTAIGEVGWVPPKHVIDKAVTGISARYRQACGSTIVTEQQQDSKLE